MVLQILLLPLLRPALFSLCWLPGARKYHQRYMQVLV